MLGLWVLEEISDRLARRSQRLRHRLDLTVAVLHDTSLEVIQLQMDFLRSMSH